MQQAKSLNDKIDTTVQIFQAFREDFECYHQHETHSEVLLLEHMTTEVLPVGLVADSMQPQFLSGERIKKHTGHQG